MLCSICASTDLSVFLLLFWLNEETIILSDYTVGTGKSDKGNKNLIFQSGQILNSPVPGFCSFNQMDQTVFLTDGGVDRVATMFVSVHR